MKRVWLRAAALALAALDAALPRLITALDG